MNLMNGIKIVNYPIEYFELLKIGKLAQEIEIQMAERLILATEFYNEVLTQLKNK